ncbi:hypothetical protein [Candidatus Tisiphia endosymbiont of Thecophora atra]|uniref:hypothetical protein n=1 Tax=Candidatus Tisiphia endosymbiont of Thecophora atra TaxID=3066258 RepID=UPI00312CAA9D
MSKQQNYWFKKQDVVKAQEILTAVQEKNIKAIYTIVGLPRAIQEKLTDKTSIDAEKILTKQLSDLKKSHDKDEKKFASINKNKPKELDALCEKLATEKQELEQVQKCLNLTHAINDTSVPIKQILTMSDVSCRVIEKLNLDRKYTTISEVVQQLEHLLSTFPSSESDSDYGSDLSRSTSETQHTVKLPSNILTNNLQQHELLSRLKEISNEFALKRGLDNTAHTNNHIDDVSVAGEYPETH